MHGLRVVVIENASGSMWKTVAPGYWNQVAYAGHLKDAYEKKLQKVIPTENPHVYQLFGIDKAGIYWEMYVELKEGAYQLVAGYPTL